MTNPQSPGYLAELDQASAGEVFQFCQDLLTRFDEKRRPRAEQLHSDDASWRGDGVRCLGNKLGQGLPAILDVTYRPGAPLREPSDECTSECDPDGYDGEPYHYHPEPCWLNVDFDTAYSYRGPGGISCGQLHAVLVALLGAWLDARGVRWRWRNEYTGEIHDGAESLTTLVDCTKDALDWFHNMVVPAITAEAEATGATVSWGGAR
jgi:hypothetical protein